MFETSATTHTPKGSRGARGSIHAAGKRVFSAEHPILWSTLAAALVTVSTSPAMANGYGQTSRTCEALAHDYAYTGSKSGYADRYQQALYDCQNRQAAPSPQQRYRRPVVVVPAEQVGCYPGAPRLYRGTLYCFD